MDEEEIKRLNREIQELTDSTTGLGASFGSFASSTDFTKNTVNKLNKELEKLLKTANALTQSEKDSNKTSSSTAKTFTKVSESGTAVNTSFKALNKATQVLITQFNDLGKTLSKLTKTKIVTPVVSKQAAAPGPAAPAELSDFERELRARGARLTDEQKKQLRELDDKLKKQREQEQKEAEVRERQRRYQEEGGKLLVEYGDKVKDGSGFLSVLNDKVLELTKGNIGLTIGWQLATATLKGATDALATWTKSVYKGERGVKVGADAFTSFAKSLGSMIEKLGYGLATILSFIPGVGWGFSGLAAGVGLVGTGLRKFAELNELSAEQVDKLYKSFIGLSRAGVTVQGGMEGILDSLQELGLSVNEIEQFNKLLAENNANLKYLGTTSGDGAKQFAKIAGDLYKSDVGAQLTNMGIASEEQYERTLKFLAQESRLGNIRNKTQEQLTKSTGEYIKELNLLSEITGTNRKEQEEARDAILAIDELRVAQFEAEKAGDTERAKILAEQAKFAQLLYSVGEKRGATGIAQMAAMGGAMATPEATAAFSMYGRQFQAIQRGGRVEDQLPGLVKSIEDQILTLGTTIKASGGGELTPIMTSNAAAMLDIRQRLDPNKIAEAAKKLGISPQEYLEKVRQGEIKLTDEQTRQVTNNNRMQQGAAITMDKTVDKFNTSVTISEAASKLFSKAVDIFARTVGVKVPTTPTTPPTAPPAPTPAKPAGKGGEVSGAGAAEPIAYTSGSGSRARFAQIEGDLQKKVLASAQEYQNLTGNKVVLNSAFRTRQEQEKLYNDFLSGKSTLPTARPGTSKHEQGKAVDIANYNDKQLVDILNKNGLFQTVPNDPVHFEQARYGGAFSGPNSGYPVMLHKDEIAQDLNTYRAMLTDAQNSLTDYRGQVSKEPISSVTPMSTGPNAGKLLNELISVSEDYFKRMFDELYKSRLLQESMVDSLRK